MESVLTIVKKSCFRNNFSGIAGGAALASNIVSALSAAVIGIPTTNYTSEVIKCEFHNNVTQGNVQLHDELYGGLDFGLGGGAIVVYMNGFLNITDSLFVKNIAQNGEGGAILNGRSVAINPLRLGINVVAVRTVVNNCKFIENQALNGGAIASEPSTFPFPNRPPINPSDTQLFVLLFKIC